jgi:hypothetical protein
VTVSALKSAIMHLGTIRQGRKAVILVSESLGRLGQDGVRVLSDLIRTANDNNTAIYTVDPRGLQAGPAGFGAMSSLLAALSDSTGGEAIVSNDIGSALKKIVSHASAFYLLGYSPKDGQLDGKFREIKVRVKQGGLQVRARNGYWAPRGSDVERARAVAIAAALPSSVSRALKELTPDNSRRAADFWIGLSPAAESGCEVSVAWKPRGGMEGRSAASISVVAMSGGQKLFDGPVKDGKVTFNAAPGTVDLDLSIHDSTGEVIDREQRSVTVPDPGATALGLSTPIVLRARNTSEYKVLSSDPGSAVPFAGRDFSQADRLIVRAHPYGTASDDAEITAQLLGPRGDTLVDLPIHAEGGGDIYELDLPLRSLATGEFLIAIIARTASDRVETLVPLRVSR